MNNQLEMFTTTLGLAGEKTRVALDHPSVAVSRNAPDTSRAAAEQAKLDAARIAAETEDKSFASKLALSQSSTTKVVVFGLLGLAVVGGAIWYFTRKK
jgi:LPXTG-motif cell wall-anchored protein